MAEHNRVGAWGEQVAKEYLVARGFAVADTDSRMGHKEVDIIAYKGARIHFVEVKTRSNSAVDPVEAIGPRKIRNIVRFADGYLRMLGIRHTPQFDIIAVTGTPEAGVERLEYIPDAFLP